MTYGIETFTALLDRLVESPSVKSACRALQIDPSSFWTWLQESSAGNPRFQFEWSGETAFLHEHYATARKRSVVLFESHLRDVVLNGQRRQVVHDGKLQYAFDDAIAIEDRDADPDVLSLLYGKRDPYLRDELNRLCPLEIVEPCAAHLSIRAASSLMSAWREHKSVDIEQRISGGVMVLTGRRPPDPKMKVVAPALAPPVVVIEQDLVPDQVGHERLERQEMVEPEEQTMVTEDNAMVDQPGDSDLVRDLRARLRRGVEHPLPRSPVIVGRPSDEDEPSYESPAAIHTTPTPRRQYDGHEGVGAGGPPPGARGVKIA
jgi:hypothetical protein